MRIENEIIASAQSPTRVGQGEDPSESGFITLTDQLGDYMQVDGLNTLVYANRLYKNPNKTETMEGNKTIITYTFNGDHQKKEKIKSSCFRLGDLMTADANVLRLANGQKGCVYTVIWSIVISGNDKKSER